MTTSKKGGASRAHGRTSAHAASETPTSGTDARAARDKELRARLNPKGESGKAQPSLAEARAKREQELIRKSNSPEDKHYRPTISAPRGRDPKADLSMYQGASNTPSTSRVRSQASGAAAHPQSVGASRRGVRRHGRDGTASRAGVKADASASDTTSAAHHTDTARGSTDATAT